MFFHLIMDYVKTSEMVSNGFFCGCPGSKR